MPFDPWEMKPKLQQTVDGAEEFSARENWTPSDRGSAPQRRSVQV